VQQPSSKSSQLLYIGEHHCTTMTGLSIILVVQGCIDLQIEQAICTLVYRLTHMRLFKSQLSCSSDLLGEVGPLTQAKFVALLVPNCTFPCDTTVKSPETM
jgi:hypothetical protein